MYAVSAGILFAYVFCFSTVFRAFAATDETSQSQAEYEELNKQIEEKKLKLQELDQQIQQFEDSIKVKQNEALNLEGQIDLIDTQITQGKADAERIQVEVDQLNLEIQKIIIDIEERKQQLGVLQEHLADYIRLLNEYDNQNVLSMLLTDGSLSDFFDRVQYSIDIQQEIGENAVTLKKAKESLETDKEAQESKKQDLTRLQERLIQSTRDLADQQSYKNDLLATTKDSQGVFEDLLSEAQLEQKQVDAEISSIERSAREKLQDEGTPLLDSSAVLSWPVKSNKGISAYFHDPSYIFRRYFEHPAIDIRVSQGTTLYAPADGYISRAKNAGMGYSFIMIIHNDEISTVFGHVSRIDVNEDQFVRRGDQIGLSGGMPGTPGAGQLTTGPHLHFEVRSKGIPVNPLDYLP
jgi:murein DD-endopeptidase MepM/ murein hydrolase activator NlpD